MTVNLRISKILAQSVDIVVLVHVLAPCGAPLECWCTWEIYFLSNFSVTYSCFPET